MSRTTSTNFIHESNTSSFFGSFPNTPRSQKSERSDSSSRETHHNMNLNSFLSQSDAIDIMNSFGSPGFDSHMNLVTLNDEELERAIRKTFERSSRTSLRSSRISCNNDSTNILSKEGDEDPNVNVPLTQHFISSILETIDGETTISTLDRSIRRIIYFNMSNGVDHSLLERILILRVALLFKSVKEHQRHIEVLKDKEMDLAKIEFIEQEKKIQELIDHLNERESYTSSIELGRVELVEKLRSVQEKNQQLVMDLDYARKTLAGEQEQYADLLQEYELERNKQEKVESELKNRFEESESKCQQLMAEVEKLNLLKINSDQNAKRLQLDLRKQEDTKQSQDMDYKWYGQQIMALEADRDMYYQQVCSLQEELRLIIQEFDECLKQKDFAVSQITKRMDQTQVVVSRATQTIIDAEKHGRNRQQFSGSTLERLKWELEELERENKIIIQRLDYGLNHLKNRMDSAKNISINRSMLFANSTINDSSVVRSPTKKVSDDLSTSFEDFVTSRISDQNSITEEASSIVETHSHHTKTRSSKWKAHTSKGKKFSVYSDEVNIADPSSQPMPINQKSLTTKKDNKNKHPRTPLSTLMVVNRVM